MIEVQQPVRPIPAWLTALVVIGCVGGAGWFLWTFWAGGGSGERIILLERSPDDGVRKLGDGRYALRAGNAALRAQKGREGQFVFTFRFEKHDHLTAEQIDVLAKVRRLVQDPAMARELNVTREQMAQLRGIRDRAKIELAAPDRARMAELWTQYESAVEPKAKGSAETNLIKALDGIAKNAEGPAKRSAAERTLQAKALLSSTQWQKFDQVGK